MSVSIGRQLKKQVKNQDVGIECLSGLFATTLEDLFQQIKFSLFKAKLILESSRNFIDRELIGIIAEPKYIASFSTNATNPTMWGHYADAERGFVKVYATVDGTINVKSHIKNLNGTRSLSKDGLSFEVGIYDEERLELKSVKYGKKPPKVNAFHRLIPKFSYTEKEDHYDVPLLLGGDAGKREESQIGLIKYSDSVSSG